MNRPRAFFPGLRLWAMIAIAAPGAPAPMAATPTVPSYLADPAGSRLEFSGTQAGAPFHGLFKHYVAAVNFAADSLAASHIDVLIDLDSLDTQDADRDKTVRGADFFNVAQSPKAHFVTRSIQKSATGYIAAGSLTLRGVTRDVSIEFVFRNLGPGATLEGSAKLKRLDFGVGQGEWQSTEWVGNDVGVRFTLSLKPKP